jgi:arginyl-tRNA synthetase
MLEQEEQYAIEAIRGALAEMGYTEEKIPVRGIPGAWGLASTVAMKLSKGNRELATEIAEGVAERLRALNHFADVYVENNYINCIFDVGKVATAVVRSVLGQGADYGRGEAVPGRVMVEYAQMNTHKDFHIGHLRNVALGAALVRIMRFAGFDVIAASYPGDSGTHVTKCLWCYLAFHNGEEPSDPSKRGQFLGDIYVEGNSRLNYRADVRKFIDRFIQEDAAFGNQTDRIMKDLRQAGLNERDIAPLMAVCVHKKPFDPANFRSDETVPKFWAIIGQELRAERARDANKHPIESERSEPLAELWQEYQRLDKTFAAWWEPSATWESDMRALYQRLETKEPEAIAVWQRTRQWSLDELHAVFAQLGAPIEVWFFESEMEEPGRQIVGELLERGIAEMSEGIPVVKIDEKLGLEKETYRVLPILRSDGTTLYSTKDLALAQVKFEQYRIERSIYVVDSAQSLHFQQVFKTLELMGFPQAAQCYHLAYEWLSLPEGKISSRSGNAISFEDVAAEAVARARAAVEEKNPDLPEETKASVAEAVGIGALLYGMVDRDNNKVIVFEWERALSFDGHAAPYIQYAHARACRILERAAAEGAQEPDATTALSLASPQPEELNLLEQLGAFPTEVRRAAEAYKPLAIANYVYELAKRFSDFYGACPVVQAEEPTRTARLALVAATRQTLANALALLGVRAPAVM